MKNSKNKYEHWDQFAYDDFNPTILFYGKGKRIATEHKHTHESMEIYYIMSGHGKYYLDGNVLDIAQGDVLFINPGVEHQGLFSDSKNPLVEFFLCFNDFQLPHHLPNQIQLLGGNILRSIDENTHAIIIKLIFSILGEQQSNHFCKHSLIRAYCIEFILTLLQQFISLDHPTKPLDPPQSHAKVIAEIINYMEEHFTEKLSLDEIAQVMYLTPSYICKLFKEELGDTPINYLIKKRMDYAKAILEQDTHIDIKNVAAFAGYDDIYYFSKLFKKFYGQSPIRYKKNYHNEGSS